MKLTLDERAFFIGQNPIPTYMYFLAEPINPRQIKRKEVESRDMPGYIWHFRDNVSGVLDGRLHVRLASA